MFYRVRTSLHERPGALAVLAARCGEAGLNILGLQIFPDLGRVTDELVVSVPDAWTAAAVAELVSGAGGDEVSVEPCTTHDLIDQPTRWLAAAHDVVGSPELLPALLEKLLGPHPERWSATEHSRAEALRLLAERSIEGGLTAPASPSGAVAYETTGAGALARVGGHVVGAASFTGLGSSASVELGIEVAPAWRRLGIGTGLLVRALATAHDHGATEVVLLARAGDAAIVPWLSHAGLRPRLRTSDGLLLARVTVPAGVRRAPLLAP